MIQRIFFTTLIIALLCASFLAADEPLKVGDMVPEFKVPFATADSISMEGLSSEDMKGKRYVIASFPAAWSSGCTREVCTFRDAIEDFNRLGVEVLPISADLVFSLHEWAKHHKLNFKLLADHTREFGTKLGVFNPEYGMFTRSVFVVGPDGKFEYIDYDYSVRDSTDFNALKSALAKLVK